MLGMNRYVALAAAAALPVVATAIAFAACGGTQGASSAGQVPNVTVETLTTKPAAATETLPMETLPTEAVPTTPAAELEDGQHFGYIKSVDLGASPPTLVFDLAYLLTGEEANEEAAKRGYPTPVDNDYFIVNDNPRLRTLALAGDVRLRLLDREHCCDTFFDGDLERFAAAFRRTSYPPGNYLGKFTAYELTVEDGVVVEIDEHYFP
jgi:hypothetical protein